MSISKQIDTVKHEFHLLEDELDKYEEEMDELRAKIEDLKESNEDLYGEVEDLKVEISGLEDKEDEVYHLGYPIHNANYNVSLRDDIKTLEFIW